MSNFQEMLKDLLSYSGLNANKLSKKIGVSSSTITRYLKGERLPTVKYLVILADYFKCTTDFLLGLDTESRAAEFKECPPFKERFAQIVEETKLNNNQFCITCGINDKRFYSWLDGTSEPYIDNLIRLSKRLDLTVDYIVGREK